MKGYTTSKDYKHLKELLDKGYTVVLLWVHDTTLRTFADLASRIAPIPGGVEGYWYSLGTWSYFPTINKESFEEYCKNIGISFILPKED